MRALVILCFVIPALAQPLSISAVGGYRFTGDPPTFVNIWESKHYLVGPMLEVRLPLGFAVEADALYSRLDFTSYNPMIANVTVAQSLADSWELPFLGKYYVPLPRVHPYLSMGVVWRHETGKLNSINYGYYLSDVTFATSFWSGSDTAFALGGGIELRLGHLRVAPEIRYVRWSLSTNVLPLIQDEGQFLLEIGWRGKWHGK